jgi:predicted ATPase
VITGEPGIGKSRLVERFLSARQDGMARVISLNASPFDADSPLLPLSVYFRALARFEADDPPAIRSRKLWEALAGSASDRDQAFPILAEFLGLSEGHDVRRSMPPPQLRDGAFTVIVAHLRALAEKSPLCLVIEDAHWLDPTTQEFLAFLAGQTADCRLLLLVTTREEATAVNWVKPSNAAQTIQLERLGTGDVIRMVQSLLGDQPVPSGIANQIARKTDGVPLYVEEFVRPFMDTPALVDWSKVELDESGPAAIPASLHEAFVARLDRVGGAKGIVQTAAVIGRVARRDILAAVSKLSEAELDNALKGLGEAGVLHPDKVAGHPCYAFGHALVRDAAYDSVLRDRRRELHARVAEALRKLDPDCVEQQPELLALHLAEGGLAEEAVPYWLQAARRSLTRSALLEATRFLQRGLSVLSSLPRTPETTQLRIVFAGLLGPALIALKGPGSAEARDLYAEAYEVCLETPEGRQHFPIYWGWWRMARDCQMMKERADALLRRASKSEDPEMLLQAHHCNWASHYDIGDLVGCCQHVEAGMAIYGQGNYRHHAVLYGNHDAKVCAHGELAQVFWMQGRLREAAIEGERSLAWARELQHLGSTAHAMDMALLHQTYRRDYATVHRLAEELMAFAADNGFADHHAKGLIFHGWAVSMLGESSRGLELLESGLDRQKDIGTSEDFPIYYCLHAEALAAGGRPERAVEELERARSESAAMGLKIWLPEIWRTLGDMLVASASGREGAVQHAYQEAARLADEQGAVMLGLRIAVSQARLAPALDAPTDVLMRLRRLRSLITQDDASADLRMADELLASSSTEVRPLMAERGK